MRGTSAKAIFLEFFRTQELLRYVEDYLPFQLHPGYKKFATGAKAETLVQSVRNQAKVLDFDQKAFEKFLRITIDGLIAGDRPKAVSNFAGSYAKRLKRKIQALPNTLDKAYDALRALIEVEALKSDQVYDAFVLLSDELSSELISREIQDWKEDAKRHEAEKYGPPIPSNIFWVSLDFHEDIDGISRYRFREHFNFGEFEPAFAEVESMFEANIAPAAAGMAEMMRDIHGSGELQILAFELWLASRSPKLSNRIRDSINLALRNIANLQSPEGWWSDINLLIQPISSNLEKRPRYLPSIYITALCSLYLLKCSIQDSHKQSGLLGAKWLLSKQHADGSWSREKFTKDRINYEPEIFTTLLALEVLIRSGIKNVEHSINSGIEWILKQQDNFGTWNDEGFPFPFMTVLVLETIKLKDTFAAALNPYQTMSKGFLQRGVQLSLEDNSNSRRLAIVTAYHGIEAFLYSVLSHPTINIPIFDKKGNTIGMRKALDSFQTHLQKTRYIKADEAVTYRSSLDRLAYLRDQVVHKAIDISQSDCRPLVDDALRFTAKYSLQIFGFDIFI